MEESERSEEDLEAQDREMLQNMHLNFERGPGRPRRWEDLSERDKEIMSIYRVFRPVIYTDIRPPWGVVNE